MILLPGGRLKSKPQGQAIPRESIYREWKISGTYSTSPFLAHSRFRLSIILFSLDEPRSEPHLRTVPLAGTINYSPLAWHPGGSELMCDRPSVHTTVMLTTPETGHGNSIFFTGSEGLFHCVLNSTSESEDCVCSKIKRKTNAIPANDLKNINSTLRSLS